MLEQVTIASQNLGQGHEMKDKSKTNRANRFRKRDEVAALITGQAEEGGKAVWGYARCCAFLDLWKGAFRLVLRQAFFG